MDEVQARCQLGVAPPGVREWGMGTDLEGLAGNLTEILEAGLYPITAISWQARHARAKPGR